MLGFWTPPLSPLELSSSLPGLTCPAPDLVLTCQGSQVSAMRPHRHLYLMLSLSHGLSDTEALCLVLW